MNCGYITKSKAGKFVMGLSGIHLIFGGEKDSKVKPGRTLGQWDYRMNSM